MKLPFAQIEPTTRCNYTCGFCAGRHMAQRDMTLETFRSFIDQVEGLEHVELQGEGEPLLHPQLFELVEYARHKFPALRVSMISNGSLFTAENIDLLLRHRVTRIFVSLESADEASFQRIRGGKLDRVRRGIANLLAERDARGMANPVVGLALTVLRTTVQQSTKAISGFYRDLGLDGGICMQPLQAMPAYAALYPPQVLGEMPNAWELRRFDNDIRANPEFVSALRERGNAPGFYELLYSSVDTRVSCPWLENGLYVSTSGDLVPCCHTKNYARDKLGDLGSGVNAALGGRAAMRSQLREGRIPAPCAGCPIAQGIAGNAGLRPTSSPTPRP